MTLSPAPDEEAAEAARVDVEAPLGVVSERRAASAWVGFWGMAGWTPSMASQWAIPARQHVIRWGRVWRDHTGERNLPWHLWQWGIDQFLKVNLVILDVEDGLGLAQTGLSESQGTRRLVSVQGFDVEDTEGIGDVGGAEDGPLGVAHEFEGFLEDLVHAVLDVHGEVFGDVIGEVGDADGL